MSIVPSDNAGSHSHLVLFVKMSNPDATADDRCIAIHGTIEEHGLDRKANDTTDCDAAAAAVSRRVVRDGAVAQRERAGIEDAATVTSRCIARDGAVAQRECAEIVDATTVASRRIARDGAVAQRERTTIGDAATTVASCLIARDGAIGEHKHALVVDDAPESFAVLEG